MPEAEIREQHVIADNMRIDYDVPIPMDDGVVLRADVFRPIAEGKYPVILTHGPYAKGLPFQLGYPTQWQAMMRDTPEVAEGSTCKYGNWETVDPEKWVPDGYACVRVDSRGAGRSPGVIDIFSPRETRDFSNCIEWAGGQPWSNGKVGLDGISYYAINQWQVAGLQPPHLAAMCAWEGAADFYRDWYRHGGILNEYTTQWFRRQVESVQHGMGERGAVNPNTGELVAGPETLSEHDLVMNRVDPARKMLLHELDDQVYRERSADWPKVAVPLLSAGNWGGLGLHLRGNVEGFVRAASRQKWLEIHGLEHWTHFYTNYGLGLQKRFFDHFLKGIDNGWDREPPVQLSVRHVDKFVPRAEQEWPIARTQWTKLYLDPGDRGLSPKPAAAAGQVEYDALKAGVMFRTAPFERETEITGPAAAKLYISSSTVDADLFLILQLVDPSGREVTFAGASEPAVPISQGWLRASHRKLDRKLSTEHRPYHSHDEIQPLTPGQVCEVDVEIWPTSIVIPPGYSLTLTVQGRDLERPAAPAGAAGIRATYRGSGPFVHTNQWDRRPEVYGGKVTLYGGPDQGSYLSVPVIPAKG